MRKFLQNNFVPIITAILITFVATAWALTRSLYTFISMLVLMVGLLTPFIIRIFPDHALVRRACYIVTTIILALPLCIGITLIAYAPLILFFTHGSGKTGMIIILGYLAAYVYAFLEPLRNERSHTILKQPIFSITSGSTGYSLSIPFHIYPLIAYYFIVLSIIFAIIYFPHDFPAIFTPIQEAFTMIQQAYVGS